MAEAQHAAAVAALREQFAALPAGAPVRLAKPTSNLFRFRPATAGPVLDAAPFDQVLSVDPVARTADVQGMVSYERLVAATLRHGLMPLVVPQLKTITIGGAVVGLGIESSSFRHGLPHESVLAAEILTGDGRVVRAEPDNEHADLFASLPNSYGTLGYALRLRIELTPVSPYVRLRHLRFDDAESLTRTLTQICDRAEHDGEPVDFVDGTVFGRDELYLTLAQFVPAAPTVSDYTGQQIYYRSIQHRSVDHLRVADYLWRWDTDWFWCSRAFGVQHPWVRRMWPRRWRRSDVYRSLVAADRRHRVSARWERLRGRPAREAVVQDVEVPVDQTPAFLDFFHREVGIAPIWLCPLRLRGDRRWPLYPLEPGRLYVNAGFWSTVPLPPGRIEGFHNRRIERAVARLGGHKSLYSTVHYPAEEFWRRYNGDAYAVVKQSYDPDARLPDLYDKCVRLT
ncbi:FAD-binding oxidoreductase [Natronosporangium hydrolyticum]|uniref:Delta(24)-sterol reductase n=1 Tax=Natronosporangium hydrolyticum TaxID=2811111 RepID=A0A895YHY2_9ACTN|nr:FAD-binding oxidoreductase [Natronosporangium hydrolyticum]QSB13348.1 FAD-binding oxidoreductase [Natronosporangium hydrolyticum]